MNFKKLLSLFPLRETEKDLFEKLFYSGDKTASEIAKLANISRPSVYDFLERLMEVGLIRETLKTGIKSFSVETPEKIQLLIEEKEKSVTDAKDALQIFEKDYKNIQASQKPKLLMYEGKSELQQMMKDLLLYRDITVCAYWPVKKMTEHLGSDFMKNFHEERIKRNIILKVIWPVSQIDQSKKYPYLESSKEFKREIRIAPDTVNFSLGYSIYNNTVRYISSSKENFGFLVESAELAEMMRSQFDILWKISKTVK